MSIEVKDWFFYVLAFSSMTLMTLGISWLNLNKGYYRSFDLYEPLYLIVYILFIGLFFLLGKRIMKKQGLNILS